jgi:hypothetical protein
LSIIVIALIICVLGWVFTTDFIIFDILLIIALFILQLAFWVFVPILLIIIVVYVIQELF